jgi:putative MATE family efflux protein
VVRLAASALGVLAAEPLYLLVDTAVVGHLGKIPLAGLAVGAVVLAQVSTQLTFLSYGTTASAARLFGAGRRPEAIGEGVQASYLAVAVGLLLSGVGELIAAPVTRLIAGPGPVADAALSWLRIALLGAPFILITMAGNGWMRGVRDTRRPLCYVLAGNGLSVVLLPVLVFGAGLGLRGSAVANATAQLVSAALFVRALLAERRAGTAGRVSLRPRPSLLRRQLGVGRDLVLRSLAFQACFLSATVVAARTSVAAVSAHQIVFQLWTFLQLVLDSLAIAAQALVGAALGGGDVDGARRIGWRITGYGWALGMVTGALVAALYPVLPGLFTTNSQVLAEIPHAWWFFVLLQPVAGVVFALDGVLLGASDVRYLRTTTLAAAVLGFLPLVWAAFVFRWGLVGIWSGLMAFMIIRLAAVLIRAGSGRWAVAGHRTGTG